MNAERILEAKDNKFWSAMTLIQEKKAILSGFMTLLHL